MRLTRRARVGTHPSFQFVSTQETIRFGNVAFAMNPLRLNRVEPGTFGWQEARQDAHSQPGLFDGLVVVAYPGANGLAFVPGGIIPNQDQSRFSLGGQLL